MTAIKHILTSLLLLGVFFIGGNYLYDTFVVVEYPAYESIMDTFPLPEEAPTARFESFNFSHPRLPHPSTSDIFRIRAENPGYFRQHQRNADSRRGSLYSPTLMAYVEPDNQDLSILLTKLLKMPFGYRGNNVKHLAVAYDWLYHQWDDSQRKQLLQRTMEGCHTAIRVIREQRLSPYNVYMYNSPLQNLVYCALATYGDSDQAKPIMNFTNDLWVRRVLPVWRQVMGKNGGWHEGGEYVGIGIGKAIYQIPAAWRSATGVDYFESEPGIRGFLDFLIFRTRPDGTQFRWGDAAAFKKKIADRIPLAIEYQHKAAYTFLDPPNHLVPTSYPWGPLSDDALYDPEAIESLPRIKYFDGIGMIIARSDWSKDALYVTFKAGNNYWSHSHLDQGSFTIYQGEAVVIDSGLYGPSYGSDHHFNYTYQTIAHNTITVTDPKDTTPMSGKRSERYIANDGGQRRVGSGWGINPAPLDLLEWQAKSQTFHTATIYDINISRSRVYVKADLTPAYTNHLSGRGTFANRTKRVNKLVRTFALDLENSAVMIFDELIKANPEHSERWLLHSIREPQVTKNEFTIPILQKFGDQSSGPAVWGTVVSPQPSNIRKLGGPGFEFFVNDKNYDEGGKLADVLKRKTMAEPGNWRLEIESPGKEKQMQFLVLLQAIPPGGAGHVISNITLTGTNQHMQLSYRGRSGKVSWPIGLANH